MLVKGSVLRTVLTLLVSTMMALPAPSVAQSNVSRMPPVPTEGGSVLILDGYHNGVPVQLAMAMLPQGTQDEAFARAASTDPGNFYLLVESERDPALKALGRAASKVKTYVADKLEKTAQIFDVAREKFKVSRQTVNEQLRKFAANAAELKWAIMGAVTYASVQGGYVAGYVFGGSESSVAGGAGVLLGILSASLFMMFNPKIMMKVTGFLGDEMELFLETMYSLVGCKMSDIERRGANMVGQVLVPLGVNAVQAYFIKSLTGDYTGMTALAQAAASLWFGFLGNWNVWDGVMAAAVALDRVRKKIYNFYVFGSLSGASLLEAWNMSNRPDSDIPFYILLTATLSGMFYVWAGPEVHTKYRAKIVQNGRTVAFFTKASVETVVDVRSDRNLFRKGIQKTKSKYAAFVTKCASLLAEDAKPTRPFHFAHTEGMQ